MTGAEAEQYMSSARTNANMHLQLELAAAAAIPMPAHALAVKRAHYNFCNRLAAAAEATQGIISPAFYDNSAKEYE